MKNRLLSLFAALVAIVLLSAASNAQPVTSTLLSQNFNAATMPPSGWTSTTTAASDPCTAGVGTYWYHSTGGNGGVGGSTYGSAVAWTPGAYNSDAYGNNYNGYYCGPLTLTTPTLITNSSDSQYVDFDLWYPYGCYMLAYAQMSTTVKVFANTNTIPQLSLAGGGGVQGNCTWTNNSNTIWCADDPASYSASSFWAHYHVALPYGVSSQNVTFQVAHGGSATYTYWYTDNVAFTNVVITNVHYPTLTIAPTSLNFGMVPVPQTAGPYYIKLSNPNPSAITLSNYTFGGANPGDFAVTRAPVSIPAGGADSVGITYTPQATGTRAATLTISTNNPQKVVVTLLGQGVAPSVSYSTNAMFLGVNTELTYSSNVQYLYVNSTSPIIPLTITGVSFYGLNKNDYVVTHMPANIIPGGGVDSIGVKFIPDIEGMPDAHMVITSNAGNNPSDTVSLHGVGILPHLAIDSAVSWPLPTVVNFDSVKLGSTACLPIQLTNPGSDTIAITKNYYESSDFDFAITPLTGTDTLIPPGGSKTINVCFTPLQQGTRVATIRIRTNIPHTFTTPVKDTSQFVINIIGVGVPTGKLMITGPATNGNVAVGKSGCVTDTLWNTGGAPLTVNTLVISGTNAADFLVTGFTSGEVIAPNSSATFQLCADPSDTGAETALLTGTGTSNGSPAVSTLALGVYGQSIADIGVVAHPYNSESCGSDTEVVTVTNTGNVPATYNASVTGSGFSLVGSGTSPVESAGGVDTIRVMFTPPSRWMV